LGKKENIQNDLKVELEVMSELKSKDDISFGMIFNINN